ncbi:MAG TPA: T9SS type A sorting domain-containing protein, partial [Chitinophagaceae bacterium]|nr:T9SS type A sorting domain-containing protein [Chitinophagaceae bacterium]
FRSFTGVYYTNEKRTDLKWSVENNSEIKSFVVEASINGGSFSEVGMVQANKSLPDNAAYSFNYIMPLQAITFVDFRIKMINEDGSLNYSRVLRINIKPSVKSGITIAPNPVRGRFQVAINSPVDAEASILFFDMSGKSVMAMNETVMKGTNVFTVGANEKWLPGVYNALVKINGEIFTARFVVLE